MEFRIERVRSEQAQPLQEMEQQPLWMRIRKQGLEKDTVSLRGKKKKGRFDWGNAIGEFLKGMVNPIVAMVKNPLTTMVMLGGAMALAAAAPVTIPIMIAGGLVIGGAQMALGAKQALSAYSKGDYERAEKSFSHIGEGFFATALSALGVRSGGAIAAEARATTQAMKAATDGAGRLQAIETGMDAALKVKAGSWWNALGENFKLFTNKSGWEAMGSQLNPRTLGANLKERVGAFVRMFKEPETVNAEALLKAAQKDVKISKKQMPNVVDSSKVAASEQPIGFMDLNPSAASFEFRGNQLTYNSNPLNLLKDTLRSEIDMMDLGLSARGYKTDALANRFRGWVDSIDRWPKPLQNFLANWTSRRYPLGMNMAHELQHAKQLRRVTVLTREQAKATAEQLIMREMEANKEALAKVAETMGIPLEELFANAKGLGLDMMLEGIPFAKKPAWGKNLTDGRNAMMEFMEGIMTNQGSSKGAAGFRAYIETPMEVEARLAGSRFHFKDAVKAVQEGSESIGNINRTRSFLAESRLNALFNQIRQLKAAKAPKAEIEAVEQQIELLTRLHGTYSYTQGLMQSYQNTLKGENKAPLVDRLLRLVLKKEDFSDKSLGAVLD